MTPHPATSRNLPLSRSEALELLDHDGYVTVALSVDADTFASGVGVDHSRARRDQYDTFHALAFGDLGASQDSTVELVGVSGTGLLVRYTTNLSPFLEPDEQDA